ncbi:TetR/AcrR family transcriptional regulator [Patulibacter sp. SYSU D01012]|uniref:TetR/AcrR family transcriptional regulator n=1 Tax=Patulibacter sp. SYSU D01012 TaxID=2817381 RepID=UPI001B30C336|nr:TetR/AcrR family transcriptional regulator [Patulibacter sp. SYSU D01012]
MGRTTRAESQAQTRAHLVATAREILLRDGYGGTSLERIATAAGYTKGAVYSNFAGKRELALAVIDDIRGRHAMTIGRILSEAGTTLPERLAAVDAWAAQALGDRDWLALEVEYTLAIWRDPDATAEFAARNAGVRGLLAEAIRALRAEFDLHPDVSPEETADMILSLGVGLGTLRAVDPEMAIETFTRSVRRLLGLPVDP